MVLKNCLILVSKYNESTLQPVNLADLPCQSYGMLHNISPRVSLQCSFMNHFMLHVSVQTCFIVWLITVQTTVLSLQTKTEQTLLVFWKFPL